jgi:teichuronic acid biosynthesis glycosyltransferase TuaC
MGDLRRKLRVLTYSSLFPTAEDPLSAPFIGERTDALARLCELKILSPLRRRTPWSRLVHASFRSHHVMRPGYLAFLSPLKHYDGHSMFLSTLSAARYLQATFRFDVIDSHWSYPDGYSAVLLGKILRVPVVITVRGSDINRFLDDNRLAPRVRTALNGATGCIAVSAALKARALADAVSQQHFAVIKNGIDERHFFWIPKATARHKLGIPLDQKAILYVGRLVPNKRIDILLSSLTTLNNVFLYIIGVRDSRWPSYFGDVLNATEALNLTERVRFIGELSPKKVADWYAAVDCVCLCSDDEGCPNVLLEAAACGAPVVARAVGGVPEIVRDQVTGLLVDSDDPHLFSFRISEAICRDWNRPQISRIGSARTWRHVAADVLVELDGAVRRHHAADGEGHGPSMDSRLSQN